MLMLFMMEALFDEWLSAWQGELHAAGGTNEWRLIKKKNYCSNQ